MVSCSDNVKRLECRVPSLEELLDSRNTVAITKHNMFVVPMPVIEQGPVTPAPVSQNVQKPVEDDQTFDNVTMSVIEQRPVTPAQVLQIVQQPVEDDLTFGSVPMPVIEQRSVTPAPVSQIERFLQETRREQTQNKRTACQQPSVKSFGTDVRDFKAHHTTRSRSRRLERRRLYTSTGIKFIHVRVEPRTDNVSDSDGF